MVEENPSRSQRDKTRRYVGRPPSRRYVTMPGPIEGQSLFSVARIPLNPRPRRQISSCANGYGDLMPKEAFSTSVTTQDKMR